MEFGPSVTTHWGVCMALSDSLRSYITNGMIMVPSSVWQSSKHRLTMPVNYGLLLVEAYVSRKWFRLGFWANRNSAG